MSRSLLALTLVVALACFYSAQPVSATYGISRYFLTQWNEAPYADSFMVWPLTNAIHYAAGNDATFNATVPWTFRIGGVRQNWIIIDINGRLSLNNLTSQPVYGAEFNNSIPVMWADWFAFNSTVNPPNQGVFSSVEGTHPNRIFTVRWIVNFVDNGNYCEFIQWQLSEVTNYQMFIVNDTLKVMYGLSTVMGIGSAGNSLEFDLCVTCNNLYSAQMFQGAGINETMTDFADWENVPANIVAYLAQYNSSVSVTWESPNVILNNLNAFVNVTATHNPGDNFYLGTTTVTYTMNSVTANGTYMSTSCSFNITVIDLQPPVISPGCPANGTFYTNTSDEYGYGTTFAASWTIPTAYDYGDQISDPWLAVNAYYSNPPGYFTWMWYPLGLNQFVYNWSDTSGNVASCIFYYNVLDGVPPVISAVPNANSMHRNVSCANCTLAVTWKGMTTSDNVAVTYTNITYNNGTVFGVGTYNNTMWACDAMWNCVSRSFLIFVQYFA